MNEEKATAMGWQGMESAPTDGRDIEVLYNNDTAVYVAMWSDRPVCMLGPINGGHPEGWATGNESRTDTNLPMDTPDYWRELA